MHSYYKTALFIVRLVAVALIVWGVWMALTMLVMAGLMSAMVLRVFVFPVLLGAILWFGAPFLARKVAQGLDD